MLDILKLKKQAINLLIDLINTPSISKKENKSADIIIDFLKKNRINNIKRIFNNILAYSENHPIKNYSTILLNSHHDTVIPGLGWNTDPFSAIIENNNKIIGLGSNDAGASVVSLIITFIFLSNLKILPYKIVLAITAEEEISGIHGIKSVLTELDSIKLGIVGEPTKMQLAIAEKGLIVLDCFAYGKTGHAARNEGINALYIAIEDINFLIKYKFLKQSKLLGSVKMTITQINSGIQHNVIPDICNFVVDIRTNEYYKNHEIINIIKNNIKSKVCPRSYLLNSSYINPNHPFVRKAIFLNRKIFGSPTLSDQSLMNFNTIKIGPGNSIRSHSPNEYIMYSEIYEAIDIYIKLLIDFNY